MAGTDRSEASSRQWGAETIRWVIVTLLIPFAGFVWNEVQEREAERQGEIERAQRESAIIIQLMPALSDPDENSARKGIALAILINLANREALAPELVGAVTDVAIEASEERVSAGLATDAERTALGTIAARTDRRSTSPDAPAAGATPSVSSTGVRQIEIPRVYIQIFDETDRASAQALKQWCTNEQRWLAPGIENVTATAERTGGEVPAGAEIGDVRYFNDVDRERAEAMVAWLTSNGVRARTTSSSLSAPPGQIEVWFPKR